MCEKKKYFFQMDQNDVSEIFESTLDSTHQLSKQATGQQELQNCVSFRMTTPKKWEELVDIVEGFDTGALILLHRVASSITHNKRIQRGSSQRFEQR
jgi:hypothetical protein